MMRTSNNSFCDVQKYPKAFLEILSNGVFIAVTYKKSWDDGFGARGWKLDATIGDPEIIASTRETGQRINTSVFVHDILDHFLSGFGVSGHRSEAMALIQLSKRTNSDPRPDYEQMTKEDIMSGNVNGESLITFLPEELKELLPSDNEMTNKETMIFLKQKVGEDRLANIFVEHFFSLGKAGKKHADNTWTALGLNAEKKTETGLALQSLLEKIDLAVEKEEIEMLSGHISINNRNVKFNVASNGNLESIQEYQVNIS